MAHISTKIDRDKELTTYIVRGELSADEIISKVKEYYTGHPTKLVLWVLDNAVTVGIAGEDIERIIHTAKRYSQSRKAGKTAIVGPKEIDYGLGRMYQAYAEIESMPYEYRIFRDLQEAKDWLGLDKA